jgi:hypothetical protein
VRQGRWHDAVRILSAASTQREAIGAQAVEFLRRLVDRTLGEARGELSERDYAAAWTEGSSLTLEQLVDEALIGDDAGASHVQGRGTPSAAGSA